MLKFEGKNTDIVVFIIQKLIKSPQIVVNIVFILKYFPFSKEYFNYVFVVVCKPELRTVKMLKTDILSHTVACTSMLTSLLHASFFSVS